MFKILFYIFMGICCIFTILGLLGILDKRFDGDREKQEKQTLIRLDLIKLKGIVTFQDFRSLIYHCPLILSLLRDYFQTDNEGIYNLSKNNGLSINLLLDMHQIAINYSKTAIKKPAIKRAWKNTMDG